MAPQLTRLPPGVSPLVKLMVREMQRQGVGWTELERRTGIHRNTMQAWTGMIRDHRRDRTVRAPGLDNVIACLQALGIELWPVRVANYPARYEDRDPVKDFNRAAMEEVSPETFAIRREYRRRVGKAVKDK